MSLENKLKLISRLTTETKTHAYIVGGYVRDRLLGIKTKDADIVVVGSPEKLTKELKTKTASNFTRHEQFGTYIFEFTDGTRIDFATSRSETYISPAALPRVNLGVSLKKDLSRRDFTINAMAIKLEDGCCKPASGMIIDYYGGLEDLKKGLLRVLHEKSFIDDPTRIIRAVRFACRFNFEIEQKTKNYMEKAASFGVIEKLSSARAGKELIAILGEKKPHEIFKKLEDLDMSARFFPEVSAEKIKNFKEKTLKNKLRELLKTINDPEKFLNKYQFSRKLKSGLPY